MNRFMILALVLFSYDLFAQTNTLTVATFNTEFLTRERVHIKFGLRFDMSDENDATRTQWAATGFRDGKFTEAAEAVAEVIAGIDADVIGLTEVGPQADVDELVAAITAEGTHYPHVFVGRSPPQDSTRQHVAILSKFPLSGQVDQLPGREGYYEELDDADTENDTGLGKGLRATVTAFGKTFHFYVVHLASERNGHEQDEQRIAQASIVRRHYLPDLRNGEMIIVMGDLNDKRGQPAIRRVRGLDDIDADLIQTGLDRYWEDDELDERWTYQFMGIRQQIDHILLSPAFRDGTMQGGIDARAVDHGNDLASDHRPLVVSLRLRD